MAWDPTYNVTLDAFTGVKGLPTSGEQIEPWARGFAAQMKFSHPPDDWGCKSTREGSPVSDAIARHENGILTAYDCVINAGAPNAEVNHHPAALPIPDQHHIPVEAQDVIGATPVHATLLGCSLFYALRAFRDNWSNLRPNLRWIKDTLGADYIRSFWSIGALQNLNDIWIMAGSSYTWHNLVQLARDFTVMAHDEFGLRVQWTISGGPEGFETVADLNSNCTRFLDSIRGLESKVELIEEMNEYVVNTGNEEKARHILRDMARALSPHVSNRLSLSSPNSVMGGNPTNAEISFEVSKMYDGLPSQVNTITPHWCRNPHNLSLHRPPNLGSSSPEFVYCNEPRGPFSSVIQSNDLATLGGDYLNAIAAHYEGYTYHSDPGIWSDMIPANYKNGERGSCRNLWDVPNAEAIAAELKQIRLTGSGSGGDVGNGGDGGGTPIPGTRPDALFAGESLLPGQSLIAPGRMASLQNQLDGNLVGYADIGDGQGNHPVWASHTDGTGAGNLRMQGDGNLVKYDGAGTPVWATMTVGHPGAMVQIQDDGNFVVYKDTTSGVPIWASKDNS